MTVRLTKRPADWLQSKWANMPIKFAKRNCHFDHFVYKQFFFLLHLPYFVVVVFCFVWFSSKKEIVLKNVNHRMVEIYIYKYAVYSTFNANSLMLYGACILWIVYVPSMHIKYKYEHTSIRVCGAWIIRLIFECIMFMLRRIVKWQPMPVPVNLSLFSFFLLNQLNFA